MDSLLAINLFAQTVQSDTGSWMTLVSSIANIGFSAIVGWYLLTKALPEMHKDFRAELQLQRIEASSREKDRREADKESLRMVIDHCERDSIRSSQLLKEEVLASAKAIEDNREVMEEVRTVLKQVEDAIREFQLTISKGDKPH